MTFYSPTDSSFTRLYAEEVKMAFSSIDCVLNREKAIYCSSELTTGCRLYDALREHHVKTAKELKQKMGADWFSSHIFNANVKLASDFAESVRKNSSDGTMVITPGPFEAPGWTQPEYLAFWETLLRTRIKTAWFNRNWQFSNGCTFEFAVAHDADVLTFDQKGNVLGRSEGIELIGAAIQTLAPEGFDTQGLHDNLERLKAVRV